MKKRILATLTVLCLALSLLTVGVWAGLWYDDDVSDGYVFTIEELSEERVAVGAVSVQDFGVVADGWYGFEVLPMPADPQSVHIWEYTSDPSIEFTVIGVQKQWIAHDTIFAAELSKSKIYALEIGENGNYTVTVHFYGDKIPDSVAYGYEIDLTSLWNRGLQTELEQYDGYAWLTVTGDNVPERFSIYWYDNDELFRSEVENDGNNRYFLPMHMIGSSLHFGTPPEDNATESEATPPTTPEKLEVIPTRQNLTVNGEAKNAEIYNINGANYFKLRDMAALLSGTGSQFSVDFDGARNTVVVKTGAAYIPVGGELAAGKDNSASTVVSPQTVEINGEIVDLTAYNIGGSNFFKLRDLGAALRFDVDYDSATATMLVTSR